MNARWEHGVLEGLRRAARQASGARSLRGVMTDCTRLLSESGEANSTAIASALVARFDTLSESQQAVFFERLWLDFSPEPQAVLASAQAYADEPSASNLMHLTRLAEPPRQELLRRINRAPGGTASIVAMRRALLDLLADQPELSAVEADFQHLLSSWFNPGFLQLRRVDWNSPARLLEQLIQHEAVHRIDGWDDLRRRLQPDRRCFAFFHPQLPDAPLIFVEVALLPQMPGQIAPLIGKAPEPLPAAQFKVATFYSISNCQPGLKGVSLGNFLIKRVADELKRELPQLKTFCTLSPIPGFARWLGAGAICEGLSKARRERLDAARQAVTAEDAAKAVHALKSMSLNIGARRVSEMAGALEAAAREGAMPSAAAI
ncbi:MAG: malonyl-CoA decarboxylase family protein, partial [Burkholderiaceae bacterium]